MYEFLADPPWYLPVVLALAAITLLFQGNARQKKQLKLAGLGVAVVAAVLVGVGYLLESEREQVVRRTDELIASVNNGDWKTFSDRLDQDVRFMIYSGRKELTDGAAKTVERVDVKNISIGSVVVTPETGSYRVDFRAMADIGVTGRRTPMDWRFFWSKDPANGAFVLYNIEYVPNAQFGQDVVGSRLVKP